MLVDTAAIRMLRSNSERLSCRTKYPRKSVRLWPPKCNVALLYYWCILFLELKKKQINIIFLCVMMRYGINFRVFIEL